MLFSILLACDWIFSAKWNITTFTKLWVKSPCKGNCHLQSEHVSLVKQPLNLQATHVFNPCIRGSFKYQILLEVTSRQECISILNTWTLNILILSKCFFFLLYHAGCFNSSGSSSFCFTKLLLTYTFIV